MHYTSTRDDDIRCPSAQAILTGLAPGGGLFVPQQLPKLDIKTLRGKPYEAVAQAVLGALLDDFDTNYLREAIAESYRGFGGKAGQLAKLEDGLYALELWHGPTAAFKDYALQLMPRLLVQARQMEHETDETVILVATSGDTGSAALAGFSDVPGVRMMVFYPQDGVSELQRLQMTTQTGQNVAVYGVQGNFDDAQAGVKRAFTDEALAGKLHHQGEKLSSANSINWGRLVPQIVYYVTSYLALWDEGAVAFGDAVDFCVPTGNFGDIMAGWYAKQLGVPVGRLICASNKNNVLSDFLHTGHYNARRPFHKTSSPSMDILVSSNLERLLWQVSGVAPVRQWMGELAKTGEYRVDEATLATIRATFAAGWADEADVFDEIKTRWQGCGYLCDPHTAVAFRVAAQTRRAANTTPLVVLSTASPFKFSRQVLAALGQPAPADEFACLAALEAFCGQAAPQNLAGLKDKAVRFTETINPEDISQVPLRR